MRTLKYFMLMALVYLILGAMCAPFLPFLLFVDRKHPGWTEISEAMQRIREKVWAYVNL